MSVTLLDSREFRLNGEKAWRVSLWQVNLPGRVRYRVRLVNEANGWHMQTPLVQYLQPALCRFDQLCRLCHETMEPQL